jgi:hypothetical protein
MQVRRGGGDDDAVEGRFVGLALVTVASLDLDVRVAELASATERLE